MTQPRPIFPALGTPVQHTDPSHDPASMTPAISAPPAPATSAPATASHATPTNATTIHIPSQESPTFPPGHAPWQRREIELLLGWMEQNSNLMNGKQIVWHRLLKNTTFPDAEHITVKKISDKVQNMRRSYNKAKQMQAQFNIGVNQEDSGSANNIQIAERLEKACKNFWRLDALWGHLPNNLPRNILNSPQSRDSPTAARSPSPMTDQHHSLNSDDDDDQRRLLNMDAGGESAREGSGGSTMPEKRRRPGNARASAAKDAAKYLLQMRENKEESLIRRDRAKEKLQTKRWKHEMKQEKRRIKAEHKLHMERIAAEARSRERVAEIQAASAEKIAEANAAAIRMIGQALNKSSAIQSTASPEASHENSRLQLYVGLPGIGEAQLPL